jgi:hypothetical protein
LKSTELDEETVENLQDLMEQDYALVPNVVSWFTGEACQLDDLEDADEDEEDEFHERQHCSKTWTGKRETS